MVNFDERLSQRSNVKCFVNLQVKYKKNMDDSALGSSYGVTFATMENGNSLSKIERANNINFMDGENRHLEDLNFPSQEKSSIEDHEDVEDSFTNIESAPMNDGVAQEYSENMKPLKKILKNVQVPELEVQAKYEANDERIAPKPLETQQILNLKNLQKNVLDDRNFKQSSEHLLCPPVLKYDESSEDCASSRSDSPSDKRCENRFTFFRRESKLKTKRFEGVRMTAKDRKLLTMILVIFSSFLVCYLPITVTKIFKDNIDFRELNIAGYLLIYFTTCINPVVYVVSSTIFICFKIYTFQSEVSLEIK